MTDSEDERPDVMASGTPVPVEFPLCHPAWRIWHDCIKVGGIFLSCLLGCHGYRRLGGLGTTDIYRSQLWKLEA